MLTKFDQPVVPVLHVIAALIYQDELLKVNLHLAGHLKFVESNLFIIVLLICKVIQKTFAIIGLFKTWAHYEDSLL